MTLDAALATAQRGRRADVEPPRVALALGMTGALGEELLAAWWHLPAIGWSTWR